MEFQLVNRSSLECIALALLLMRDPLAKSSCTLVGMRARAQSPSWMCVGYGWSLKNYLHVATKNWPLQHENRLSQLVALDQILERAWRLQLRWKLGQI